MNRESRIWLDGLKDFAAARRREKPLEDVAQEPSERAAERMILQAQLSAWLAGFDYVLRARQAWLQESGLAGDTDPAVVATTSGVGIEVVEELAQSGSLPARAIDRRIAAVTELEYRLWCIQTPDNHYALHGNVWNWIKVRVPAQRHLEFARHPLGPGECYWLHRAGIAGAGAADRRDCHLWKWNGLHASLLEAFVVEQGVADRR